jgi:hypothetical protein
MKTSEIKRPAKWSLVRGSWLLAAISVLNCPSSILGQGTAFTYQGRLNIGGAPANGLYDFRFRLDADPVGNTILATVLTNAVGVTNGLFMNAIDFGPGWFNGSNYWLEVDVRTNNAVTYTVLSPFQPFTPTPYAVFATTASNLSGTLPAGQLSGQVPSGNFGGTYGNAVALNNAGNSFTGSFTGNGSNVSNVNATALNGLSATNFWQLGGNNVSTGRILGSTNNQALEVRVGNQRALVITTNPADSANFIGGSPVNVIDAGVEGAVISGGGTTNFLGAASSNRISANFSTIAGGSGNWIQAGADHSFIGAGLNNFIVSNDFQSVIAGGQNNTNQSTWSVVGGGGQNLIQQVSQYSAIGGGNQNTIGTNSFYSIIGGGQQNAIQQSAWNSTIGGGWNNAIQGNGIQGASFSTIAGGENNTIDPNSNNSMVGGGQYNSINNTPYGTVGGGYSNSAIAYAAVVAGGQQNVAGGENATVGGGVLNHAVGNGSVIAGGGFDGTNNIGNAANGTASSVGGGVGNSASAGYSGISGGAFNTVQNLATYAFIGGGYSNTASGSYNAIGGGYANFVNGNNSFIGGGGGNIVSGTEGTIGGGGGNMIGSSAAFIGGGLENTNLGFCAVVPGGRYNLANGAFSLAAGALARATNDGTFVWSDDEGTAFGSTSVNQFSVRANGGVRFVTSGAGMTLDGQPVLTGNIGAGTGDSFVGSSGNATTSGSNNTADGGNALRNVTSGSDNTAIGYGAMSGNASGFSGSGNTAVGYGSLLVIKNGSENTALGLQALGNLSGGIDNIALGFNAGFALNLNESNNIYIGNAGVAGENNTIRIGTPGTQTATYIAGTINGDGGGLTNVWQTGGNSGTSPGANYLGTSDNQALELHVNGSRALRLEPTAGGTGVPNVIGGWPGNLDDNNSQAVTIGGGGAPGFVNHVSSSLGTIAGGSGNVISTNANDSTIGGGRQNTIDLNSWGGFIGGGHGNWIQMGNGSAGGALGNPSYSVIGGGYGNVVGTNINNATIGGGGINTNSGSYATIPGGYENLASASYAFAAGQNAQATNTGAFVWSDDSAASSFASTNNNSFSARAAGGFQFYTTSAGRSGSGLYVAPGGNSWVTISDRNAKKDFAPVNCQSVLDKLSQVPIEQWHYKWESTNDTPNIGPMAQDFIALFYPGRDDKGISTLEFDGVELAAIQGLNQKLHQKDAEIAELKSRLETIERFINARSGETK